MIGTKTYKLNIGSDFIIDSLLAYSNILRVKREGLGFNLVDSTPVDRECLYTSAEGKIQFQNAGSIEWELITVLYNQ